MSKKDEPQQKTPVPAADPFTFNSEKTREVPSLNLLLNRKKLEISNSSNSKPPSAIPQPQQDQDPPSQISISAFDGSDFEIEIAGRSGEISVPNRASPASSSTPKKEDSRSIFKIQKTQRKLQPIQTENLAMWELSKLKHGSDPLGKALVYLFEKGATNALFLSISPPPQGSTVPLFLSSAALEPKERKTLWIGLQWDPRVVPEVWNFFLKTGVVEFAPPGTMTNVMSNRNVIRGAFGVEQDEWLSLLRVGELSACRGVAAIISKSSLQLPLRHALRIISDLPEKQAV